MSAFTVALRADASEVPALIAGSVNLVAFSGALAQVGIVGRYDADRGVLVIEEARAAPQRCPHCAGLGVDDDARCAACGGTGQRRD